MTATITRRTVASGHGSTEARVRQALEAALTELTIDTTHDAQQAMLAAGLSGRVARFGRELDRFLDDAARAVTDQARTLAGEVGAIHEAARRHQADALARAPRISGTFAGARS